MCASSSNENWGLANGTGGKGTSAKTHDIQRIKEKHWRKRKMEFKFYQKELELQSRGWIPTFHDISKEIIEIVKDKVTNSDSQILVKSHGRPSQKILIISLSIPI